MSLDSYAEYTLRYVKAVEAKVAEDEQEENLRVTVNGGWWLYEPVDLPYWRHHD